MNGSIVIRLLKSFIILGAACFSLLILIVLGLYGLIQSDFARNKVTDELSTTTGMQWRIEDHSIDPDGVELVDVFVLDHDFGFSVNKARIEPKWSSFLSYNGDHRLNQLSLTGISLDLTKQPLDQFGLIESTLKNAPPMEDAKWLAKVFIGLYLKQIDSLTFNLKVDTLSASGEFLLPMNRRLDFVLTGEAVELDALIVNSFTITQARFY